MKKVSLTLAGVVLALAGLALPVPAQAAPDDRVIHIKNKSDWEIHHLFLSPVDTDRWGPDQLGNAVISVGGSSDLHKVACGAYDIKIVDEDGDECIIGRADLCAAKEGWVVTNDDLLDCDHDGD